MPNSDCPWIERAPKAFVIRSVDYDRITTSSVIAANNDVGVLYGAFHFLRLVPQAAPIARPSRSGLSAASSGAACWITGTISIRTVERGYAGQSIWDWHKLPDYLDPRYADYARACASLGINGTVPTNVNASPIGLTAPYLRKYAALADVFRPYGLRVYLTARFSAPIEAGGLKTADPLDPAVRAWWKAKADGIYAAHSRFRRLSHQSQLRRTTRPPGLLTYARRRREHAGGRRGTAWRHHHVARVCVFTRRA